MSEHCLSFVLTLKLFVVSFSSPPHWSRVGVSECLRGVLLLGRLKPHHQVRTVSAGQLSHYQITPNGWSKPRHTPQIQLPSQPAHTTAWGAQGYTPPLPPAKCPTELPVAFSPRNMCSVTLGHMKISESRSIWVPLVSCMTCLLAVGCYGVLLSWMPTDLLHSSSLGESRSSPPR